MGRSLVVVVGVVVLGACNPIYVDVLERHPSPRLLWPRPVDTVQTYSVRPRNGVAVYGLAAEGEKPARIERAIRKRAASLGCDGILYTVRAEESTSPGVALTGKLNQAREYENAHMDALCIVDPDVIPIGCPVPAPPAEVERAARDLLEQWRLGYEQRSEPALAALYAHDASLIVVDDGGVRRGWRAFEPALRDQLQRATALHVRLTDIEISPAGASVVVVATLARERTDATTTSTEDVVVTLVLRKPDPASAWVIVSEHTSYRRP